MSTIQQRTAADGTIIVEALMHLGPDQAGVAADAVRGVIGARYRVPALSTEEILTLRELTTLGDALDGQRAVDGISVLALTIARLGLLAGALRDAPTTGAASLLDSVEALHADALRVALGGEPALS